MNADKARELSRQEMESILWSQLDDHVRDAIIDAVSGTRQQVDINTDGIGDMHRTICNLNILNYTVEDESKFLLYGKPDRHVKRLTISW